VSDVEISICERQPAGFIERGGCAICLARLSCSEKRRNFVLFWIELFDLVVVSVGDQDLVTVARETEWVLQANVVAGSVNIAEVKQIAADKRLHCTAVDVDRANNI